MKKTGKGKNIPQVPSQQQFLLWFKEFSEISLMKPFDSKTVYYLMNTITEENLINPLNATAAIL